MQTSPLGFESPEGSDDFGSQRTLNLDGNRRTRWILLGMKSENVHLELIELLDNGVCMDVVGLGDNEDSSLHLAFSNRSRGGMSPPMSRTMRSEASTVADRWVTTSTPAP